MRTDKFFDEVCGKINEIDKLLQVTISWSRVMQLNPDTTINGENGDSISVKWESVTKGVKDLAEDINSLNQEELLQVADMIAELRKKFRIIEKRMDKHIKAFNIYIERETSHEIRVQRNQSHGYWAFIYRDMQLVIDTLYNIQRSRYSAEPLTAAEETAAPQRKKSGREPYTPESFYKHFTPEVKDRDAFVEALRAVINDRAQLDYNTFQSGMGTYIYLVIREAQILHYLKRDKEIAYPQVVRALGLPDPQSGDVQAETCRRYYNKARSKYRVNTKLHKRELRELCDKISNALKNHLKESDS